MRFEYRIQRMFLDGRWMTLQRFGPWDETELDAAKRELAEQRGHLAEDKQPSMKLVGRVIGEWEDVDVLPGAPVEIAVDKRSTGG